MPDVTLTITLSEAGQVSCTGPLENRLICYGLMELAKEVIREHSANMNRRVIPASPADQLALRGNGH